MYSSVRPSNCHWPRQGGGQTKIVVHTIDDSLVEEAEAHRTLPRKQTIVTLKINILFLNEHLLSSFSSLPLSLFSKGNAL
jgi:hypothetical protein